MRGGWGRRVGRGFMITDIIERSICWNGSFHALNAPYSSYSSMPPILISLQAILRILYKHSVTLPTSPCPFQAVTTMFRDAEAWIRV